MLRVRCVVPEHLEWCFKHFLHVLIFSWHFHELIDQNPCTKTRGFAGTGPVGTGTVVNLVPTVGPVANPTYNVFKTPFSGCWDVMEPSEHCLQSIQKIWVWKSQTRTHTVWVRVQNTTDICIPMANPSQNPICGYGGGDSYSRKLLWWCPRVEEGVVK